ncbi:MAG: ABC transporter permease [Bacteroidota bacterium]
MFGNYLKYAVRYLLKNSVFSIINISGLTVGLASFFLIMSFVQYELSYDHYVEDKEDVYRVNLLRKKTGTQAAAVGPPVGPALKAQLPGIKDYVRLRHADNVLVRIGEEEFYENKIFYVDSTFLKVFTFDLLAGDANTALKQKNEVIISSSLARKYFGDRDPLGQIISIDNQLQLTVVGVAATPDTPSHFEFGMVISFETFQTPAGYPVTLETWGWASFPTYVKLESGSNPGELSANFDDFMARNMGAERARNYGLVLQPISDIHLYSRNISERNGMPTNGDIKYVQILLAIAFLILGLAIFNFANLSTTLSLNRVKEVGVRKTQGGFRTSMFWQYMTEAILISLFATILAIACLEVFSGSLSYVFGTELSIITYLMNSWHQILIIVLVVGFLGGAYPALFLARLLPAEALQENVKKGTQKFNVKRWLVGGQFFITIALLVSSLVVRDQMQFLREKDLGYAKDQIIGLKIEGETLSNTYLQIRERLLLNPNISSVTASSNLLDGLHPSVPITDKNNAEEPYRINLFSGHYDYAKTLGLNLVEGRDFSDQFSNDSSGFIINEAAVKMFDWKDSAVGKKITVNVWEGEVIGVVEDFHFTSLHKSITPMVIHVPIGSMDHILVKTKGNLKNTLVSIREEWNLLYPDLPFDYLFLDEHVQKMYKADENFSVLIYTFSGLAILLACMGLYGIISYSIDAKQKEIGIRKVLGASVTTIIKLLSSQFLVLILASAVLAIPFSWYFLTDWLSEFAFKVSLSPAYFVMAVVLIVLLSLITMSFKTLKTALTNPVDVLKED